MVVLNKLVKPVGSHADVKELEYISALHQTCTPLRRNGTIDALDIVRLLLSRFGLQADEEVVRREIVLDLGGVGASPAAAVEMVVADEEVDDSTHHSGDFLDLRQLVSILLIPHLAKCSAEGDPKGHVNVICQEICAAMSDTSSSSTTSTTKASTTQSGIVLTRQGLEDFLKEHNILDANAISPTIVTEMLAAAGGEGVALTPDTLLRALTHDLAGYNVEWETKLSTSYADILGAKPPLKVGPKGSFLRRSSEVLRTSQTTGPVRDKTKDPSYKQVQQPEANTIEEEQRDNLEEPQLRNDMESKVYKVVSFASLDNTADTYGSQTFAILLWLAFICVFIAYVYSNNETGQINKTCDDFRSDFGCKVALAIVNWLVIFVQLMVLGGVFFMLASTGNSVFIQHGLLSICFLFVSIGIIALFTIVPLHVVWETWFFNTNYVTQNTLFEFFNLMAYLAGVLLILLQLRMLLRLLIPFQTLQANASLRNWLSPGAVKKELRTKQAAAFKVNRMVENALHLHGFEQPESSPSKSTLSMRSGSRQYEQTMNRYLAQLTETEESEGILWAWKGFWNGSLCSTEGIWFHTRLLASALAHCFLLFVSLSLFYTLFVDVTAAYAGLRGESTYCAMGGCVTTFDGFEDSLNNTNYTALVDTNDPNIKDSLSQSLVDSFGNTTMDEAAQAQFYQSLEAMIYEQSGVNITTASSINIVEDPYGAIQQWMIQNAAESDVKFGISIGLVFSLLSSLWIMFNYIPSFVFNVLQFRYGIIPTLYSADFEVYRFASDHSTLVFAMAFWAQLFTAFFAFAVPGGIAFLIVWDETQTVMQNLLAQLIGIFSTLILKILVLLTLRGVLLAGFYRQKLGPANVLFVLLECWNIALSTGFVFVRAIIFLLLSIFYLGRIDIPFLAPGVDRLGPIVLDRGPVVYRKDLLLHEAHRHPFLDRLAAIYLLKLNLGNSFGTRAGATWRLIFVLTLMPWLSKYRVIDNSTNNSNEELAESQTEAKADVASSNIQSNRGPATAREAMLEDELAHLRLQVAYLQAEKDALVKKKKKKSKSSSGQDDVSL